MDVVTIDLETYYDKDYSLSKMTTEAYIRDPRFEIIGVGIKVNDYPADWYSGSEPGKFLKSLDYSRRAILCHNTFFDGAVMSWHFGIKPKIWLDTLSMARPLHGMTVGGSLANLATHYGLGKKGDEVIAAIGKRRGDFTEQELARYGSYCTNDVELTYALWKKLKPGFPPTEIAVIDQILRMFIEPEIELDVPLLEQHLAEVLERKAQLLGDLDPAVLMSNVKFADALLGLDVLPPMKKSPSTGNLTYAFSKTDRGLTDLLEHPDERVQNLVAARLGTKSTLEETRTKALIGVADRGRLPIMLNYYGAHTGRCSGGDKLNLQNFPSRSGNNSLRRSLKAPPGHVLIASDSSQIEARLVAWLAQQEDLLDAFRQKRDVYSEFATKVYGRPISKANKVERFVGKTCIAEGTLVLSHRGWKPIESVTTDDLLWDGQEWVCHQGLLNNGIRPTLNLCGAWLTPDHQVWSGTQWLEAQSVVDDEAILSQSLDTGAENLPLQATLLAPEVESVPSLSNATATKLSIESISRTSRILEVLAALCAPRKHRLQNAIGCTAKQWQTIPIGLAYSIASLQRSLAVTPRPIGRTSTTVSAAFGCAPSGALIEQSSYGTFRPSTAGTTRLLRWIESMWTGIMNRGISASYRAAVTSTTSAKSQTSKRVYDILNCGSRNRFTILTEAGPLVVHNCILGLGYGMGAEKLQRTLALGQGGISVDISVDEAQRIVNLYRNENHRIAALWNKCGQALGAMYHGNSGEIRPGISYDDKGILLPSGFRIQYPMLRPSGSNTGFVYLSNPRDVKKAAAARMTGQDDSGAWTKIYGGKVTENYVQGLAAYFIRQCMAQCRLRHIKVVFQVHDELIIIAPEELAERYTATLEMIMTTPPSWAPDLPLACESGMAVNYGDTGDT